jgi:hypothetical protein
MARRTNRVAWGLAGGLAASLLAGVGGLSAYGRQTGAFTVRWQPLSDWRNWWFGKGQSGRGFISAVGTTFHLTGHVYSLWFVTVEVPYRGPEVVIVNTCRRPPKSLGKVKGSTR